MCAHPVWEMTDIKLRTFFFGVIHEENNLTFVLYIFEGVSALIEIPKNCVVAAVGKELSEYDSFFSFIFFLKFYVRLVYTF